MRIFPTQPKLKNTEIRSKIEFLTSSYSLTDQIGRSSRSICSNLAESFAKRRYPKHFISKITDAAGENYETQTWIEFAEMFNYLDEKTANELMSLSEEVGPLLSYMEQNPDHYAKKR